MSAADRAEARRKAILSRGTDRLAKLSTSARGEDAPAYMHDDPPLSNLPAALDNLIGEEPGKPPTTQASQSSSLGTSPLPRITQTSSAGSHFSTSPDTSVWSEEQQQQFLDAMIGGSRRPPSLPNQPRLPSFSIDEQQQPMSSLDNPLATMFSSFEQSGSFSQSAASHVSSPDAAGQPTRLHKLMLLIHLISMWCLLGFFVLYQEPKAYEQQMGAADVWMWRKWAELARNAPEHTGINGSGWAVHVAPFFWAFATLQITLHSARIFSGFDAIQPPMLLALLLPHLPPPFSSIIVNCLKYLQMGSMFLDDVAVLIVGIGFIVFVAGWFYK